MNSLKEKDKAILQKEQLLNQLMIEYYSFDMQELKNEVEAILGEESKKVQDAKDNKLKEIANNFKRIMSLAQEHVAKGSGHKVNAMNEEQVMQEFEQQSEVYEKQVHEANLQKQQLRQELAGLEIEIRRLRDQVADKQLENKNLQYIVDQEEQLKGQKGKLEKEALKSLQIDLEDQISQLQNNAEKITGKVTPFGMEQVLQEKFRQTTEAYKRFIEDSERDLDDSKKELERLQAELEKENYLTDTLQREVNLNETDLNELKKEFGQYKKEFDDMNFEHDMKLKELEDIRKKANEEIKRLSVDLSQAQSEINVLILESQKYESQLEFLATEREMILKAQMDGQDIDPYLQVKDLNEAEEKRKRLEEQIGALNREWFGKLEKVRNETERVLSETEIKEFRGRIALLAAELNDKNQQIQEINKGKEELEKMGEKAMSMGMQLQEQTQEIEELNERYKQALREKVSLYDELIESVKELVNRNARFMKNEIEICRLVNECSIMKRELEQKEKTIEDLAKDVAQRSGNDKIVEGKIKERIDSKVGKVQELRKEIRDRDVEVEFLEYVLKEKQRKINEQQRQQKSQNEVLIPVAREQKRPVVVKASAQQDEEVKGGVEKRLKKDEYYLHVSKKGDRIAEALAVALTGQKLKFPIKKIEAGFYVFGTRKVLFKVLGENQLVVRVGTGFLPFSEFMNQYYDKEVAAVEMEAEEEEATNEQIVTKYEKMYLAQIKELQKQ